jgi:hypothetical protein
MFLWANVLYFYQAQPKSKLNKADPITPTPNSLRNQPHSLRNPTGKVNFSAKLPSNCIQHEVLALAVLIHVVMYLLQLDLSLAQLSPTCLE